MGERERGERERGEREREGGGICTNLSTAEK